MLGYIEYAEDGATARLERQARCGAQFLVMDMGKGARGIFSSYRAARSAEKMRALGVRRAVFPVDFPHTAAFLRAGVLPVDPAPLRCALGARFVKRKLDLLGLADTQPVVAVCGEHMNAEIAQTVRELASSYRYVMLSVRSGGEEFAAQLRRQYGTALILAPSDDQLERADALVMFAPRRELRRENPVLCTLYPGGDERGRVPIRLDSGLRTQVADNCAHEQLAAALYGLGIAPAQRFLGEITC